MEMGWGEKCETLNQCRSRVRQEKKREKSEKRAKTAAGL